MSDKKSISIKFPQFDFDVENSYEEEMNKIIDANLAEASTTRTLKNITETLTKSLKSKYGITDKEELKEKVNALLKLHGLAPENFDPIAIISKLTFGEQKTVNDISIDDNANKTESNMTGIMGEAALPYQKIVGFDYLYQIMKELYGKEEAKKCSANMYDLSLYLNDPTKILIPYCYCIDASKIVVQGRKFGQVHSSPAHRISTYISVLGDTIREMSFNLAGAIAIGTFFLDIAHLGIYKERITLDDLKTDKKIRKAMSNHFQQFIHTVNHYSRNSIESPFTNVSCFDRDKLNSLIGDDNYGWYFPKKAAVIEDNNIEDTKEAYKNFVLDYIEELQEIYIDEFDNGDPLRGGLQFPFPVTTVNFGTTKDENGNKLTYEDNKLLNYITKKDISRYNIYCSEGTKVASCCFSGSELIKVYKDKNGDKELILTIEDFVKLYQDKTGQEKIIEDWYIDSLNSNGELEKTKIIGILNKQNSSNQLIKITINKKDIMVTPDHKFKVKNVQTDKEEEITALDLSYNLDLYLLPVIE